MVISQARYHPDEILLLMTVVILAHYCQAARLGTSEKDEGGSIYPPENESPDAAIVSRQ